MAISINWNTKVIFVPKSHLVPIRDGYFELDVDQFRKDLKNIEDNAEGMVNDDTHRHNTEVSLSGVTYARVVEIINGYTIEFEDDGTMAGHYTVILKGANHNIADVKVPNAVSIVQANSAGLQTVATGAGPTVEQIASGVLAALQTTAIPVDLQKVRGQDLVGTGGPSDPWGPAP